MKTFMVIGLLLLSAMAWALPPIQVTDGEAWFYASKDSDTVYQVDLNVKSGDFDGMRVRLMFPNDDPTIAISKDVFRIKAAGGGLTGGPAVAVDTTGGNLHAGLRLDYEQQWGRVKADATIFAMAGLNHGGADYIAIDPASLQYQFTNKVSAGIGYLGGVVEGEDWMHQYGPIVSYKVNDRLSIKAGVLCWGDSDDNIVTGGIKYAF
jgi:hypothetical protein